MKVFFAGHNNFGNRGCEALVRSIAGLVRDRFDNARFVTPSQDVPLDAKQWLDAYDCGVDFIQAAPFPTRLRWWNRLRRIAPSIEGLGRPTSPLPYNIQQEIDQCDVLVMTGGDTISLDYDLPSLYDHASYIDAAKRSGRPSLLWAASVGPFVKKPHVERFMVQHLRSYAGITVRETATYQYLQTIGIDNVVLVADPAFTLVPQCFDISEILPEAPEGVIGLNVSPLIRTFREGDGSKMALDREVVDFIKDVVERRGYGVVLLPHVGQLNGGDWNSDFHYMQDIWNKYGFKSKSVRFAPSDLNAAQLKHLLSKFRFFIGARTHATIGAFSSCVPTVSIAYSVKAKGINRDLFGDTRFVLDTPDVSKETLLRSLDNLEREEDGVRAYLGAQIPLFKEKAKIPVSVLQSILQ